jgi:DNA-binding GntR family transcriptional regulator
MADKPKGKGLLLAIMGAKKPMKEEPEDDEADTKSVAAQAVLDAIEAKDAAALADAMDSMVKSCMSGSDDDDY